MVSESDIAEARRKALRNGEEDPVAVAQRYLNVYRQMHIFSEERKESFDQSLLNLSPLTIGIISSLPGGLTFQDYIDEVLARAGRDKSARDNDDVVNTTASPSQPQILSNIQSGIPVQPVVAPIVSGEAKISMDKDFAGEFANIMKTIIAEQAAIQNNNLNKIVQDLGKTQLFIAKKIDNNQTEHQEEVSKICKVIAQSHTALTSSLADFGQTIVSEISKNSLVDVSKNDRKAEDDIRLAEMITQSQEIMMSRLLARLPQAIGVGNVNVNTPSRSVEDDIRLVDMITRSQEKVVSEVVAKIAESGLLKDNRRDSEDIDNNVKLVEMLTKSQEKIVSEVVSKIAKSGFLSKTYDNREKTKNIDNNLQLVDMITQSQERLILNLTEKLPQIIEKKASEAQKGSDSSETRMPLDDERLLALITKSQENMIKSLIEQNILSPRVYESIPQPLPQEVYVPEAQNKVLEQNVEENNIGYQGINESGYVDNIVEIPQAYNEDNIQSFSDTDYKYDVKNTYDQPKENADELVSVVKKKKKKKKKKKSDYIENNIEDELLLSSENDDKEIFDLDFNELKIDEEPSIYEEVVDNQDSLVNISDIPQNEETTNFANTYEETTSIEYNNDEYNNDLSDEILIEKENDKLYTPIIEVNEDDEAPIIEDQTKVGGYSWKIEDDEDSWGFHSDNDDQISAQSDDVGDNNDDDQLIDEGWEYVEYDEDQQLEEGWEYVECDENGQPIEDGWEYVEAIGDNAQIYSTDSYSQQSAPVEKILTNNRKRISLINVPQIYDETNDDDIDDPYKK